MAERKRTSVDTVKRETTKRIAVEEALNRALEYFKRLYASQSVSSVQLEEVVLSDDNDYWFITLSYREPDQILGAIKSTTKYKIFQIHAETGAVKSMKIRDV
ncbi:MAG: hypothetical protein HYR55_18420 [Acidobacteria bacterium]|nr:hypothetical protein [Acidobacteriota bacterium]MBI3655148.1 hypothetical protein [Acidobacteriota bacterium]